MGLDQNNLPFSTAHPEPSGLDFEIAGLLAEKLGVRLRIYWAYSSHDSYPSKLASKGLCDVILGVMPDDRFGTRVLYSRPYYYSRYLVVARVGEAAPSNREPLAVEEGVAVRGLEGRAAHPYPGTEAVLEAVATGREKAGYVISTRGPWLARKLRPEKLVFRDIPSGSSEAKMVDRFPISAAVRKSDGDLKDAIDRAWDELDRSGRLAQVFARWHIRYEPSVQRRACAPGSFASEGTNAGSAGCERIGRRAIPVSRALQRLSRRVWTRRQRPRLDRWPLDSREQRRRHRPRDRKWCASYHDEKAG